MRKIQPFTLDELVSMENFNKRIATENDNIDEADKAFKKLDITSNALNTHIDDQQSHVTQVEKDKLNNIKPPSSNFIRNGQFNVSQRGYDYSEGKSYRVFADGWQTVNGVITTKINDGIKLSQANTNLWCFQGFETKDVEILSGNRVTASALVRYIGSAPTITMNIYSWQGEPSALTPGISSIYFNQVTKADTFQKLELTFNIPANHTGMCININPSGSGILEIKDVKLEIGDIATPYVPKSYGEELSECQRYYRESMFMHSGFLSPDGNTVAIWGIPNNNMRIAPRVDVKAYNTGELGKVDLIHGYGSGSPTVPTFVMSNAGISRIGLTLPAGFNGIQGLLIEDAEIY